MFAFIPLLIVLLLRCLLTFFHQRLTSPLLFTIGNPRVHLLQAYLLDRLFEVFVDSSKRLEHSTAVQVVLDQPHCIIRSLADHLADWAKVRFLHV